MDRPSPISGTIPPAEHRWKKGQSGNPAGRPKNLINRIKDITGLEVDDTTGCYEERRRIIIWLLDQDAATLKSIISDQRTPLFMTIISRSILSDIKKGHTLNLETIWNRFYGRPTQQINLGGVPGHPVETKRVFGSPEEIREELRRRGLPDQIYERVIAPGDDGED
jgi:hypothetical protein